MIIVVLVVSGCQKQVKEDVTKEVTSNQVQEEQPTCPKGVINDSAPGMCSWYIDENKDGICDES